MRTLAAPLEALLAADRKQLWFGDMYTLTLASGTVLRWSGADIPLTWQGSTWELGPGIDRDAVVWKMGLAAEQTRVRVYPKSEGYVIDGQPIRQALARGMLDGASMKLDRSVARVGGAVVQGVVDSYFSGRVTVVEPIDEGFELTIKSPLSILDRPYPPNIYQAQCTNRLYDSNCGLNPATFQIGGTITTVVGTERLAFVATLGLSVPDNHFQYGTIKFTSGQNNGRQFMAKGSTAGGAFALIAPLPGDPQVGDTFLAWPGCDKRQGTCSSKFSNIVHFKGVPYIPAAETTL